MKKLILLNVKTIIFLFLIPFFSSFSSVESNSKIIDCYKNLKSKTTDLDWITQEMIALVCGPIEVSASAFEFVSTASLCLHQLDEIRPPQQSYFDYAILCSGVESVESINNRFACVSRAYRIFKERWSERDKYILCSDVQTVLDYEKAISCYQAAKAEIKNIDDPQVYAILCSGGKR